MKIRSVRGAVTITEDSEEAMDLGVTALISEIMKKNALNEKDIINIQLSQTKDLIKKNSAASVRKLGFRDVPLFCVQEADIEGMMNRVVRVLITAETRKKMLSPVYLGETKQLRPDIQ